MSRISLLRMVICLSYMWKYFFSYSYTFVTSSNSIPWHISTATMHSIFVSDQKTGVEETPNWLLDLRISSYLDYCVTYATIRKFYEPKALVTSVEREATLVLWFGKKRKAKKGWSFHISVAISTLISLLRKNVRGFIDTIQYNNLYSRTYLTSQTGI